MLTARCRKCAHANRNPHSYFNKVKIKPTKEELNEILMKSNYSQAGRNYGVSANAVKKWAKKLGIYKNKSEH